MFTIITSPATTPLGKPAKTRLVPMVVAVVAVPLCATAAIGLANAEFTGKAVNASNAIIKTAKVRYKKVLVPDFAFIFLSPY
jgi:hypothetical protein